MQEIQQESKYAVFYKVTRQLGNVFKEVDTEKSEI